MILLLQDMGYRKMCISMCTQNDNNLENNSTSNICLDATIQITPIIYYTMKLKLNENETLS